MDELQKTGFKAERGAATSRIFSFRGWSRSPLTAITEASLYCDRYIRGDIQISTGRTMTVPLPRGSPLTLPPILPPIFVPPCHIQPYVIDVIIFGRL